MNARHRQCRLERIVPGGVCITTSYLPVKYAIVGSFVKLKNKDQWTDNWKIIHVGSVIEEEEIPDHVASIKKHRKNTGDALPKR